MDNLEIKLSWLAGIIDGEGYVGLRVLDGTKKHPNPKRSRRGLGKSIHFVIKVETVNMAMINAIRVILDRVNIGYSLGKPTMKPLSTKPAIRIEVRRKNDVLRLTELVLPYSVVKKQELELLHSYLIKTVAYKYYRISERDLKLAGKMRELHDINGRKGMSLAVKPKSTNNISRYGNTELNRESEDSRKCVEYIEATTQIPMSLS